MILRFVILLVAFALMPMIPGVKVKGIGAAAGAALVFVFLSFFLGWALKAMLVIGTLGLAFLALNFLTNLVLLWLTDKAIEDVEIKPFGSLLLATLWLTVASVVGAHLFRR